MIRKKIFTVLLVLLLAVSLISPSVYAAPQPELVSLDATGTPVTDNAFTSIISGSGRYVAYDIASDTNSSFLVAVFVRDRVANTTTLASILPNGDTANAGSLSGFSKDGRSVVFTTEDGLYVRNLDTDQTILASVDSSGVPFEAVGGYSTISENGSRMAFAAGNGYYVRDVTAGVTTQIVSGIPGYYPVISADGNFVAYNTSQTYVYNWTTGTTTLASAFSNGSPGNHISVGAPAISDDGRYVAFANNSTFVPHAGTARMYRRDMQTGQMQLADVRDDGSGNGPTIGWSDWKDAASLAISGDGTVVAFGASNLGGFTPDVTPETGWYARNFTTGRTGLVTANADGEPILGDPDFRGSLTTDGAFSTFASSDPLLGITDGIRQIFVNSTVGTGTSFDAVPPVLGTFNWTINPKNVLQSTTLSISVSDAGSGVQTAEYFVDVDPGQGNGTPMSLDNGVLSATFGTELGVGVYPVYVRAQDAAGNWSDPMLDFLVVTDNATGLQIDGKNKKDLIPSLQAGDMLPGLIANNQIDAADYGFKVSYKNGVLDPHNDFQFHYETGTNCKKPSATNCHVFDLNATAFYWLVIDGTNNSRGRFQGTATVTVDGATTSNPFMVEGTDANMLPSGNDHLLLKVYPTGSNPATAAPIWQASGDMVKGNSVRIH